MVRGTEQAVAARTKPKVTEEEVVAARGVE